MDIYTPNALLYLSWNLRLSASPRMYNFSRCLCFESAYICQSSKYINPNWYSVNTTLRYCTQRADNIISLEFLVMVD